MTPKHTQLHRANFDVESDFFGVCTYLGSLSFVCCEKNSENILNGQHSKEGRKMSKQLRPTTNVDGWIKVYVVSDRGQTTGRRNRVYESEEWRRGRMGN